MHEEEMDVNKRWWDGATPVHFRSRAYDVDGFRKGASSLLPLEIGELGDVKGKSLLHLQCHFGMDTMSWARRGAVVTGVDFSPEAIRTAKQLSDDVGIPARFIESNVYSLGDVLEEKFDIIYTGYGAICWLPDLDRWAKIISRFLKPGGTFYMVEGHPITSLIDEGVKDRLAFTKTYFDHGPERWESPNTYTDSDVPLKEQVSYAWNHTIADVVSALTSADLRIEWLHESPLGFFGFHPLMRKRDDGHWHFPPEVSDIPLTFSIKARLQS
jgi:SAM-dependent methyltransferase